MQVCANLAKAPSICLVTDGWSGLQRRHMLNVILTTPAPFLVTIIYTDDHEVSADYQRKELLRAISDLQSEV